MLDQKWNSERPLVFAHVVLKSTISTRKVRVIQARINCLLVIWERGIHAGLVGDALAEVRSREGRFDQSNDREKDCLARIFHSTFLSINLRQEVRWSTNWEGGRCLLLGDVCTKTE